ncbi:MAG: DUF3341 domain-containing protein [Acidobacteriota bacterium]
MALFARKKPEVYGVIAEFDNPQDLLAATKATYEAGYRRIEAYTPYPIEEVSEAVSPHRGRLPLIVLLGGIIGGLAGYALQYYTQVIDYSLNIGGRPFHSWPSFVPVTFETTILGASLAAVFGMLGLNGLPRPHHPIFNAPGFERASRNHFFLLVECYDQKFNKDEVLKFLNGFKALEVSVVDW